MKVENNNKIISIGILLIGISLFYYFIIAPIIADSNLQNCIEKAESGGGRIFSSPSHRDKERDLCFKLYKK